jgi:hypothetical protein
VVAALNEEPGKFEPIIGDPKRQAIASFRGYAYQVARTLMVWLDLPDDEWLIVEGVEDFDRYGKVVELNQVKAAGANITLRSTDVTEAIQNLFDTQEQNKDRRFTKRFIATAHVGTEQSNPFSGNGIDLWNDLRRQRDEAKKEAGSKAIAAFIAGREVFSEPLRAFCRDRSWTDVYQRFIEPLYFDYGLEDLDAVEDQLRARLALLGEKYGVPASDSEKALGHLWSVIWHAASLEDSDKRMLDRARLLREFEAVTSVSVPKATLSAMAALQQTVAKLRAELQLATTIQIARPAVALSPRPSMPAGFLHREGVCAAIDERLTQSKRVVIIAGRQHGKTAALSDYIASRDHEALWLDLSGSDNPASLLLQAANELSQLNGYSALVIDALPVVENHGDVASSLAALIAQLQSQGIPILISAQREIAASIRAAGGITAADYYALPAFNENDIAEYLSAHGCPAALVAPWVKVLLLITAGEPLLVNVRVAALEYEGFAGPALEDVFDPHEVVLSARKDLRLTAAQTLPAEQLDLLNRLSLLTYPYSRELAVRIASIKPSIQNPGNAFDSLAGGWVQHASADQFRTSSLASSFGRETNGMQWVKAMSARVARIIASGESLTTTDVASGLMQAFIGDDDAVTHSLLSAMFEASDDLWQAFASATDWLPAMCVGGAALPKSFSNDTRALLRLAQVRVSLLAGGRISPELWLALNEEYPANSTDDKVSITRLLALTDILLRARSNVAIRDSVGYTVEWSQLVTRFVPDAEFGQMSSILKMNAFDPLSAMGFLCAGVVASIDELRDLLQALEGLAGDYAKRFVALLENDRTSVHAFLANCWTDYLKSDDAPWDDVSLAFEQISARFCALGLLSLADSAAAVAVNMVTDFGAGAEAALGVARRLEMAMPSISGGVDYEASVGRAHFMDGKYPEALARLSDVQGRREWDGVDLYPHGDFRYAAMAAAKMGDWKSCAEMLLDLAKRLSEEPNILWKTAAYFDSAFAFWKAGDTDGALSALGQGANYLVALQIDSESTVQYMVLKRIGQAVYWLAYTSKNASAHSEAPPAMASNLNTDIPAAEPRPPETPVAAILLNVVRFEYVSSRQETLWLRYGCQVGASDVSVVRVSAEFLEFYRAVRAGATAGIVGMIGEMTAAAAPLKGGEPLEAGHWLVLAALHVALRGTLDENVIAQWRAEAEETKMGASLADVFRYLEAVFVTGEIEAAWALAGKNHANHLLQILGSLRYAGTTTPTIGQWLRLHAIWVRFCGHFPDPEMAGAILLDIVVDRWAIFVKQRFMLAAPAQNAPPLEAALILTGTVWERIRAVLLAAEAASGATLPAPARAVLDNNAGVSA